MALRGRPHALHAGRRHENGRGVAGRDVIDQLVQVELSAGRRADVSIAGGLVARLALPFVRLVPIVEAQVVVDRLGRQHGRKEFREDLHAAQGAVPADADQPLDLQPAQPVGNLLDRGTVARVDVVSGSADDRPAAVGRQFGNRREQGIQPHVRHARVEQGAKALDETQDLDLALVGPDHRAIESGVEGRRVSAGRKDADAFHARPARRTVKRWRGRDPGRDLPREIPATSPDGRVFRARNIPNRAA